MSARVMHESLQDAAQERAIRIVAHAAAADSMHHAAIAATGLQQGPEWDDPTAAGWSEGCLFDARLFLFLPF